MNEYINCIICGKNQNNLYAELYDRLTENSAKYILVKCHCNFIYLNPRPNLDTISKFYNSPSYLPHKKNKKLFLDKIYGYIQKLTFLWKYKKISNVINFGKFLDIGAGAGDFASYMSEKKWDVTVQDKFFIANKNYAFFDDINNIKKDNYFDIITMWHSLEHIHDVENLFFNLSRLLNENGTLFIAVPNINAPEKSFYKTDWAPYDPPRHLYHFSIETINRLCNKYNFKIYKKYSMYQDLPYNIILSIKSFNIFQLFKGLLVFIYSILITLIRGPKYSSSFLIVCKKY